MKCDFCGREFKLSAGSYRLLPIMDLRQFPPRGVYACSACVDAEGVEALVDQWFLAAEGDQVRSQRRQDMMTLMEAAA